MVITVDIGNSNTVIVTYEGSKKTQYRFETVKENVSTYYYDKFIDLDFEAIEAILVSCVVPRIEEEISAVMSKIYGLMPLFIDVSTVPDFKIHLDNPKEIGADFIATAFGAIGKYHLPTIIVDVGSATKLTYVDKDGAFGGGIIVPGLGTSIDAMYQYIPHLPKVPLSIPDTVIGTTTTDAMQSGMLYGLIAQIEGLANRMEKEIGSPCTRVLTGGYAAIIEGHMPDFNYDPTLLNDGLLEIYKRGSISWKLKI